MANWRYYVGWTPFQQGTLFAGVAATTYIVKQKTTQATELAPTPLGCPFPIVSTPPTPGVDTTVYLRIENGVYQPPLTELHVWKRKKNKANIAIAQDFQGMPLTLFNEPPTTNPLFFTKEGPSWYPGFVKRRKQAQIAAGLTSIESHGYNPALTPAGDYAESSASLLSEIQRHMLEGTIDGGVTWSIWTQAQVVGYLNERLQRFLLETGTIRTRGTIAGAVGTDVYDLPSDLIELRRVTWNDATNGTAVLGSIDKFQADNATPGWENSPAVPYAYIEDDVDPLSLTPVPPPSLTGTFTVEYVANPTLITTSDASVQLAIPGIFAPFVKYGIMADMLSVEGEANDPRRAAYCEQRFIEGIQLAQLMMGYVDESD